MNLDQLGIFSGTNLDAVKPNRHDLTMMCVLSCFNPNALLKITPVPEQITAFALIRGLSVPAKNASLTHKLHLPAAAAIGPRRKDAIG